MSLGRNIAIAACIGLFAGHSAQAADPAGAAEDKVSSAFATWKAAHPNLDARIADLKAKTAALVKTAAPLAAGPKYADLATRSASLTPQQKEQAEKLFVEGFGRVQLRDFAGAKKILAEGLAIDPASGPGNFYMGDILDRAGDETDAALSMDRARTLAPNTAEGRKAAVALPSLAIPVVEDPSVDRPPAIWRVPGAVDEVWDSADAPELVVIPAGEYTMGSPPGETGRDNSESPRHRVRIGYPLAVGKYPVTVAEFAKFVAETGYNAIDRCETFVNGSWVYSAHGTDSWRKPGFPQGGDSPVVCLNWHDAQAYVAWISKKTGHTYRLLSEAEYEYAARAGTTTAYWWGDDATTTCGVVNAADLDAKAVPQFGYWNVSNCHDGFAFTAAVHSFKPNPFGLYGISGNTVSWVQDCWSDSYNGAPNDGSANYEEKCVEPIVRGGTWADKASGLRAAYRGWNHDWIRFSTNGFRVAREL